MNDSKDVAYVKILCDVADLAKCLDDYAGWTIGCVTFLPDDRVQVQLDNPCFEPRKPMLD